MTSPNAHQLIAAILWLSPLIQTLAVVALATTCWLDARRRGGSRMHPGMFVAGGGVVLALHAGYFLAPMWWTSGRCLLGAATMLPVALMVVGSMVVIGSQRKIARDIARVRPSWRLAAYTGAGVLALAYVGPVLLMLAAWA